MKKDKITKNRAIVELKALGLSEKEAIGTIEINLPGILAERNRQAINAILNQIDEEAVEQ